MKKDMGFLRRVNKVNKTSNQPKKPFFKKKPVKIVTFFVSLFLVFGVSFLAYIYANGSKIFDNKSGNSLIKIIKGEQSQTFSEDRVNILVMGRGGDNHPGGLLTDSIMMISIKPKENKVALLSIPRDLLVPIKGHGQDKINSAYADGYNDYLAKNCKKKNQSDCVNGAMAEGARVTSQTVADVLGQPIHYYTVIDFAGFEKLIDSLGGVDIFVDKAIYDPFYPDATMTGYQPFNIKAGQQHLDGKTALKYARSRETSSDFDRARRQQQILAAVKEKTLKLGFLANPAKLAEIINIVGDHVRTDLSPSDLKSLANIAKNVDSSSMITQVLSNTNGGPLVSDSSTGTYYLRTKTGNFNELKKIAQNIFDQQQTEEKATIEILNGSKISGAATKLSTTLKSSGYEIINAQNSKEQYAKTVIYDYSNGTKKQSTDFLSSALGGVSVQQKTDSEEVADVVIVIGNDYQGINIK